LKGFVPARIHLLLLALPLVACANEYHPEYHPETAVNYSQNMTTSTNTTIFAENGKQQISDSPSDAPPAHGDPNHVLILQSTHLDRPTEVVGVIDAHLPVGDQDAAMAAPSYSNHGGYFTDVSANSNIQVLYGTKLTRLLTAYSFEGAYRNTTLAWS